MTNSVPACRPVINNVVDFNIKFFNLYRHKYAGTTSYSINNQNGGSGDLPVELDGQARVIIHPGNLSLQSIHRLPFINPLLTLG